jgi:hypothetical protein
MNMFVAGAELVRWELTAIRPDGPYRLTMHHARGSIVEYFRDVTSALNRQTELETLLKIVGSHGQTSPSTTWVAMPGGVH